MTPIANVGFFLLGTFFTALSFILWLRIAVRYFNLNTANQLVIVIKQITNPVLNPIAKIFSASNKGRYDWPCFGVLFAITLLKYVITSLLFFSGSIPVLILLMLTIAGLILQPLDLMFYAIIGAVILSWVSPGWYNPLAEVIHGITNPLLSRIRSMLPDTAGLDFSPWIALVILKCIVIFVESFLPFGI